MPYGFTLYGASLFLFMLARNASGVRYGKATHSPTQCCFYVKRSRLCVYLLTPPVVNLTCAVTLRQSLWWGIDFGISPQEIVHTNRDKKASPTTRTFLIINSLVAVFCYYTFFEKYLTQGFIPLISIQDKIPRFNLPLGGLHSYG